jgi:hypothetical protein
LLLLLWLVILLALLRLAIAALVAVTHGVFSFAARIGHGLENQRVARARFPAFEPICGLRRTARGGFQLSLPLSSGWRGWPDCCC